MSRVRTIGPKLNRRKMFAFQCLNRREQGSNLSLANLMMRIRQFQCLNRREQGSNPGRLASFGARWACFNASIGVSRVRTSERSGAAVCCAGFNASIGVSRVRTSANAADVRITRMFQCLNRREQGSNSASHSASRGCKSFQCLNRREQGSNRYRSAEGGAVAYVSMPQSA